MRPVSGRTPYWTALHSLPVTEHRVAVRQVAAVREAHAEQRVARRRDREVGGQVGRRAGVRLHVGVLGAEQLPDALERQLLGDVDELAAAVVALARQALGVLVGHHRAQRLEHRRR